MAQARRRRAGVDGRISRCEPVTESCTLRQNQMLLPLDIAGILLLIEVAARQKKQGVI